jgi:23S rRNA pseudouridine2457 synthase
LFRYFIIYKPFQVLSQFTLPDAGIAEKATKLTLKDIFVVPRDVYPVGRLDYDSEGLLILTSDPRLNHRLLHPAFAHEREYWVQVEGIMDDRSLQVLRSGIDITIDGKPYRTGKCFAERFVTAPDVPERNPPIRFRKNIPSCWIRLVLTEGKNRQVRKMTAKAGFPTLRLIRHRIKKLTLHGMMPGQIKELEQQEMYERLFE